MLAILALMAGIGLVALGLWARTMGLRSQSWATAEGEIIESRVDDFDLDNIQPILVYSYFVKGSELRGSRVSFSGRGANRESIEQIVTRYSPKQRVTVYYDPSSPSSSVLENHPSKDWPLWVSSGFAFLLVGVWLLTR